MDETAIKQISPWSSPWEKNNNSIWLTTTLLLRRNLAKFNFPERLDSERRILIANMITQALTKSLPDTSFSIYESDKISPLDRDFFSEQFLIFDLPHESHREQRLVTTPAGTMAMVLNSQDHIEFHVIEIDNHPEHGFDLLTSYERAIEPELPFAFSKYFGYLTSDPLYSGTGLSVQAYLHIPGICFLTGKDSYVPPSKTEDCLYSSLQGDAENLIGHLLVLKNRYATTVSEEAILSSVRNAALRIVAEERAARKTLQEKKDEKTYNAIRRALGTILYSSTMDTSEALQLLSLIKFGIEINAITEVRTDDVNALFFDCRRGHIAKKRGATTCSNEEIARLRAEELKKVLGAAKVA